MNKISGQVRIGAIGELLVQLRFLQYDVQAAPPLKDSGNDLIAIRGEQWRAIQVKTTQTREGRCVVYFLEKHEINKGYYTFEELAHRELSGKLIDQLFPRPEAAPAGSA
jgi:5-hydroxyisourate hydrolase-like protein (transthyretin family)